MPLKKAKLKDNQNEGKPLEIWLQELKDASPDVRRKAALHLQDVPEAREALEEQLREETDAIVCAPLVNALLIQPSESGIRLLLEFLRGDSASRRTLAVDALREMEGQAFDLLASELDDSDPDVRIMAVNALQMTRQAEVGARLAEHLEDETHPNVVAAIVEALLEVGSCAQRPVLESLRDRYQDDDFLAFAIDATIEAIGRRADA